MPERTLTREDVANIDLIFQYLDGTVEYQGEMVENIVISLGKEDGAELINAIDVRDELQLDTLDEGLLSECEILIYIDNAEQKWTPIEPSVLDDFIQQIKAYHSHKGGRK
jgi:hypothetical protein